MKQPSGVAQLQRTGRNSYEAEEPLMNITNQFILESCSVQFYIMHRFQSLTNHYENIKNSYHRFFVILENSLEFIEVYILYKSLFLVIRTLRYITSSPL